MSSGGHASPANFGRIGFVTLPYGSWMIFSAGINSIMRHKTAFLGKSILARIETTAAALSQRHPAIRIALGDLD